MTGQVISAPLVHDIIPNGEAIITGGTGGFSEDEATNLSALIRGGALPVELKEVETSVVGPSIGMDALWGKHYRRNHRRCAYIHHDAFDVSCHGCGGQYRTAAVYPDRFPGYSWAWAEY